MQILQKKVGHYESECWTKEKVERKQRAENKKQQTPAAKQEDPSKKRKLAEINFAQALYLDTTIAGQKLDAIIDTGATISAVARRFTTGARVNRYETLPIKVGSGEIIQSLGSTEVEVAVGNLKLLQTVHVVDTNAFDCVLGMDSLSRPHLNGILMHPARLIVDDMEFPLREETNTLHIFKLTPYKSEDYKLKPSVRSMALAELEISPDDISIDLFASSKNTQEKLFCSKSNTAWRYNWQELTQHPQEHLWVNPPFSKIARAVTKVALEKAKVVMVTPDWGVFGPTGYWRKLLDRLTVRRVDLPDVPIYEKFGDASLLLPKPHWQTMLSVLDGGVNLVSALELANELFNG